MIRISFNQKGPQIGRFKSNDETEKEDVMSCLESARASTRAHNVLAMQTIIVVITADSVN